MAKIGDTRLNLGLNQDFRWTGHQRSERRVMEKVGQPTNGGGFIFLLAAAPESVFDGGASKNQR